MDRRYFGNFDAFVDSIRGINGRFIPTALSTAPWWLDIAEVGEIEIQRVQIGSAGTFAGTGTVESLILAMPMTGTRNAIRIDGEPLAIDNIVVVRSHRTFIYAAPQPTLWVTVAIPLPLLQNTSTSRDLRHALKAETRIQAPLDNVLVLRDLLCWLLEPRRERPLQSGSVLAVEAELLGAVANVLASHSRAARHGRGRPLISRSIILKRALGVILDNPGRLLSLGDLRLAAGVSERTIRKVFVEYFGVSPQRMLKARQLYEIRKALQLADPDRDSVTSIASRLGIWDFSSLARDYRNLYGESPSQTLRLDDYPRSRASRSWIQYAIGETRLAPGGMGSSMMANDDATLCTHASTDLLDLP